MMNPAVTRTGHSLLLPLLLLWVSSFRPCSALIDTGGSCSIVSFLSFTETERDYTGRWPRDFLKVTSFGYMAAAQMAVEQFNARDSSVVPELADLGDCNVHIPYHKVVNDHGTELYTVIEILEFQSPADVDVGDTTTEPPCAAIGPNALRPLQRTASTSLAFGIPHMSYKVANSALVRGYDNIVGVSPTDYMVGWALASYLQDRPGFERDYIIAHGETGRDASRVSGGLEDAMMLFERATFVDGRSVEANALHLKNSGINTVFLLVQDTDDLLAAAIELDSEGLLDGDHLFIVQPSAISLDAIDKVMGYREPNSPMDKLLNGALMIGHTYETVPDAFLQSWRQQNSTFVEQLKNIAPAGVFEDYGQLGINDTYFQDYDPFPWAAYTYDSVMAIGLGACGALANINETRVLSGEEHTAGVLNAKFSGASGPVSFNARSQLRDASPAFGVYNIRPLPVDPETGNRTYETVLTSRWSDDGGWQEIEDFVYHDGTIIGPPNIRKMFETNYLPKWVHAVGLTLFAFSMTMTCVCVLLVHAYRNHVAIKAAQPFFLQLVCVGSVLMTMTMFFLSWDESYGKSASTLDLYCTLAPWFFVTGHLLMFSALFTKLWRLDKVMQMRRNQRVSIRHVILPLVIIMGTAVAILLLWTATEPWVWEREMTSDNPPITFGRCTSDKFEIYSSLLGCMLAFAGICTAMLAWKTSDIAQDFSDTNSIFYAIVTHLEAWFVGIPILIVVGNDSVATTYLGRVLLIWVFAASGVVIIVMPKLYRVILLQPARRENSGRGAVHVTGMESGVTTVNSRTMSRSSHS